MNPRILRPLKFALVGATGVVVNSGVLYLGHEVMGLALAVASPIAIAVAIFSNFNINNYWTWRSALENHRSAYFNRLARYYLSASLGGLINYGVLLGLVHFFGMMELVANLFGILAGTASNYLLSEFWVFKKKLPFVADEI